MRKLQFLIILFCITVCQTLYSQTVLELQRNNRNAKILKKYDCIFSLVPISNEGKIIKKQIYFGQVVNFKDSVISLKSTECNTVTKDSKGKSLIDYHVYQSDTIVKINLRDISYIQTDRNWFMAPALIGSAALASAIIVSPVLSFNFKDKTFDTDKYIKLGGYSLLTSAACLTVAFTIARKNYYLNSSDDKRKHRLWHVRPTATQ